MRCLLKEEAENDNFKSTYWGTVAFLGEVCCAILWCHPVILQNGGE